MSSQKPAVENTFSSRIVTKVGCDVVDLNIDSGKLIFV